MSDILRISLVQSELVWGKVDENLQNFKTMLAPLKNNTDLIVLPEMFTSGFIMEDKDRIAPKAYKTFKWMKAQALELNATIIGSIIVSQGKKFYNRLFCIDKNGLVCSYDKRHLFRMGNEHDHFSAGTVREVLQIGKWRICPLVCYDLRFPVWSRNRDEYDLLLYVANWPVARMDVWNTLLKARAIENQAFVAGVNRVGIDGMNLKYSGGSMMVNARGEVIGECQHGQQDILTLDLNLEELKKFREKFPVLLDADSFRVNV